MKKSDKKTIRLDLIYMKTKEEKISRAIENSLFMHLTIDDLFVPLDPKKGGFYPK